MENKYIKYINLGDPIAVLGFIDSVLGSVDLWRGNFGIIIEDVINIPWKVILELYRRIRRLK